MNVVIWVFRRWLHDGSGQDLIEYALVAALVGLGATAVMRTFSGAIASALTGIGSRLTSSV